jgi:hypothetical protein
MAPVKYEEEHKHEAADHIRECLERRRDQLAHGILQVLRLPANLLFADHTPSSFADGRYPR